MIDKLVIYTNASIQPLLEKFEDVLDDSDKYPHFKLVDQIDMKAFIGILYLRAAFRLNLLEREIIWNHESAHDIFGATMPVNRFKFICRFCTFDDKTTQQDRWKNDKFACMQEIFEAMNSCNASMRCPLALLAVDETLYPYSGHIGFKQYNPHKPAKYGLLYRSLCDSTVTYTYFSLAYACKPEVIGGNGAEFYITGTDEYTKYLVNGLSCYTSTQGCNATFRWTATFFSMDRYFLAEWALQKKFTIVGTMCHDSESDWKQGRKVGAVCLSQREKHHARFLHRQEKIRKKYVIVLSTMHDSVKVTNDQRKKPQIHSMYDHMKGGIDVVDLLSTSHSTRIKCKRWPINAFAFILDTYQTNAKTILQDNGKQLSNFEFTYAIGKGLVLPAIQQRYANSNGLQIAVVNKMRRVLDIKEAMHHAVDIPTKGGRYFKCIKAIMGSPNYIHERNRLNNKLKTKCFQCNKYICKVHQVEFICGDCKQ